MLESLYLIDPQIPHQRRSFEECCRFNLGFKCAERNRIMPFDPLEHETCRLCRSLFCFQTHGLELSNSSIEKSLDLGDMF